MKVSNMVPVFLLRGFPVFLFFRLDSIQKIYFFMGDSEQKNLFFMSLVEMRDEKLFFYGLSIL
jgi:hypothetical protein